MALDVKAEAAGGLEELLQQALRMASESLLFAKQNMPKEDQATYSNLVKLGEQLVGGGMSRSSPAK